ncbi:MAG: hypothetical protein IJV01_00705 [Bacteroidales bacterium]|nr:hypothetical protein [Bacteroidales bacterium]
MKKCLLIAMAVISLSLAYSCNPKEETDDSIVGTWVCNDPVRYNDGTVRDYTETYVFNSDGTMTIQFICVDTWDDNWTFGIRFGGTYTTDGTRFSFKAHMVASYEEIDGKVQWREQNREEETRDCSFEYKIEGKKMTVYYGHESAIFGHGGSAEMTFTKQ